MTNLNSPTLYGSLIGVGVGAAVILYFIWSSSSDKKPKQFKFPITTGEDANLKEAKNILSHLNPLTRSDIKNAISRTFSQNKPLFGGKRNKRRSKKIIKRKK